MYTSDTETSKKIAQKTARLYLRISLFAGLFSAIYEYFSHGVYSNYMIFLFLFPLIGGVLPFSAMSVSLRLRFPERPAFNLYNSGIATLTVGCCLQGILEIYGTTSDYMPVYWAAGTAFVVLGIVFYLLPGKFRTDQ